MAERRASHWGTEAARRRLARRHRVERVFRASGAGAVAIAAIALWGIFNVPGDPSRGGGAPIVVPGLVRLGIEALVLGGAVAALFLIEQRVTATVFAALTLLHYALSLDRLRWLIER